MPFKILSVLYENLADIFDLIIDRVEKLVVYKKIAVVISFISLPKI